MTLHVQMYLCLFVIVGGWSWSTAEAQNSFPQSNGVWPSDEESETGCDPQQNI